MKSVPLVLRKEVMAHLHVLVNLKLTNLTYEKNLIELTSNIVPILN